MIALSTLWNATRHENGLDLVREAVELGFPAIEVNYKITERMFGEITACVARDEIRVVSLHNFSPLAESLTKNDGSGDLYLLSSTDEKRRTEAVEQTKRTIDHALEAGAEAVVVHLGKSEEDVRQQQALEQELRALTASGDKNRAVTGRLRAALITMRERAKGPCLEAVVRSLDELAEYASQHRVMLGIENRAHFCEIPSFEEIEALLERFDASVIGYWHDTGHAQIFENLGFVPHQEYLKRYSSRLLGIHLHDSRGNHDHLAPGTGSNHFEMVARYVDPTTLKVLEVKSTVSAPEIQQGLTFLRDRGIQ
ncbi:MAG: sugar phosphate isomerase/epimerase [Gemmatimonadota bacterium]|nr:MAG: sugar phosphate isomerase/epimerase [Gemmatimonadota bacterium]